MGSPVLSVTVLNYNYGRFLGECLDSILGQTFRDFELILIDDCSKDDSMAVASRYTSDPRVRVIRHDPNRGYVYSLHEGVEQSQGRYISVISADDLALRNDAFERQLALLDANASASFCFSAFAKLLEGQSEPQPHHSFPQDGKLAGLEFFTRLLTADEVAVLHSGTIIRRSTFDSVGGYARNVKYAPDTDMWLRLCLASDACYSNEVLYGYRIHASQMSGIGSHRAQMIETIDILDRAFEAAERQGVSVRALKHRATQGYLFGAAMDEVFRGNRSVALQRYRTAVGLRPLETLTSRQAWIVLLRAVLGQRGFALARRAGRLGGALTR